jgi:hypothetical protein
MVFSGTDRTWPARAQRAVGLMAPGCSLRSPLSRAHTTLRYPPNPGLLAVYFVVYEPLLTFRLCPRILDAALREAPDWATSPPDPGLKRFVPARFNFVLRSRITIDLLASLVPDAACAHLSPARTLRCGIAYTLHPPYTLHPAPCTLHPTPCTRHPTTYTLNPARHPTPDTRHPKRKPSRRRASLRPKTTSPEVDFPVLLGSQLPVSSVWGVQGSQLPVSSF